MTSSLLYLSHAKTIAGKDAAAAAAECHPLISLHMACARLTPEAPILS